MELKILGPVEVYDDGGVLVSLSRAHIELLTLLALSANLVVPTERLMQSLWPGESPGSSVPALRTRIFRLRHALGDPSRILTVGSGYRLRLDAGEFDLHGLDGALSAAREATKSADPAGASAAYARALGLWRGPTLDTVADAPWACPEINRLEEIRITAAEERAEAELATGRHAEQIAELEALCKVHPYRERFWAARMRALDRAGRTAEALEVFQQFTERIGDALGLEPSPDLVRLARNCAPPRPLLRAQSGWPFPVHCPPERSPS